MDDRHKVNSMKIISFEYRDHATEWSLETIEFQPLSLLVGASGVGKTRILEAILHLKQIARGASLNGVQWKVNFLINDDVYEWNGKFEHKWFFSETLFDNSDDEDEQDKPNVATENLSINGILVIERTSEGIFFNGTKTVKLSQKESAISLLKEEDQIKSVHSEFSKILFDGSAKEERGLIKVIFEDEVAPKKNTYKDLPSIRNSAETLRSKLYLTYVHVPDQFEEIKNSFIAIFPYIEDVKIEPIKNSVGRIPHILREVPFIQIKEVGIQNWIDERKLSSGMYRTLMHIAELYLCADGTVILIDEFENSLGINCIDEITSSIVTYERDLQFIITSHHPYIINNISSSNWKVITRKAGAVKNYNATQLNIGKSKHEAFTQLINLDKYFDGVEV